MSNEKNFDVAISCAEEDIAIGSLISGCLIKAGVSCYLYTNYTALDWGENIFRIFIDRYGINAKLVLIIISSSYIKKYWSGIEMQVAQAFNRHTDGTLLPLRLDDSKVEGLSPNISYIKWKQDPENIADFIKEKLNGLPYKKKDASQTSHRTFNATNMSYIEKADIVNLTYNFQPLWKTAAKN